jgi:medium-chain acyl-[acyl-carrier-protein] hydrolase
VARPAGGPGRVDSGGPAWFSAPVPDDAPRLVLPQEAHSYEVDAFGLLTAPGLSGWLQEAAGRHATELGVGVHALLARGLTWVLLRQAVEIDRPIRLWDRAEVTTWPSGVDRVVALRDFEVRVGGALVVRATTQWLVLDVASRRPVRPGKVLPERFHAESAHAATVGELPPVPAGGAPGRRLPVRYLDIDQNLHVTNATYLGWALEAVPEQVWREWRVRAFEIQFLAESLLGEEVESRAVPGGEGIWDHAVTRPADGKELARVRTAWVPR